MNSTDKTHGGKKYERKSVMDLISSALSRIESRLLSLPLPMFDIKAALSKNRKAYAALCCIFWLVFGFLSGCASVGTDIRPFAASLLCACEKYTVFIFIGAAISCAFYPSFGLGFLCLYILIFTLKLIALEEDMVVGRVLKTAGALVCGIFVGVVRVATGSSSYENIIYGIVFSLIASISAFFFSALFDKDVKRVSAMRFVAVCLIVFSASKSVFGIKLGHYDLGVIASLLLLLVVCLYPMPVKASILSVVATVGSRDIPLVCACFAACLAASSISKKCRLLAPPSFIAVFSAMLLYLGRYPCFLQQLPNLVLSVILFLPLLLIIPRSDIAESEKAKVRSEPKLRIKENFGGLSSAFSSLSNVFFKLSDKRRYPDRDEVCELILDCIFETCKKCQMCENCYLRDSFSEKELTDAIYDPLICGNLKRESLPEKLTLGCGKIDDMICLLNSEYSKMLDEYVKNNRHEILASQYSSVARMINYASEKTVEEKERDTLLEAKIQTVVEKLGVPYREIAAFRSRPQSFEIRGIHTEKLPCSSFELREMFSEKLGKTVSEPEYEFENGVCTLKFSEIPSVRIEYSQSSKAKGSEKVNGDSVSFFKNDEEFFYALISDGMGSGRDAALTSRLTSVFLEKLLSSGAQKSATLEMLNGFLLSKNDECFATVDLLEIDLLGLKASFIKAGAAPAYVVRTAKLYKISAESPPAGIITGFCAESISFDLEVGDIIVMLSDGIVGSFDESPWLAEILSFDTSHDPSLLSNRILERAINLNIRDDDMSVAVLKVVKA